MRVLCILIATLAVGVAFAGVTGFVATRDSPARAVLGDPKQTVSGGAQIEYFVAGPAGGDTIVLLPSYARSASDFNELATALHDFDYGTVAIQPRGVDGSSLPSIGSLSPHPRKRRRGSDER